MGRIPLGNGNCFSGTCFKATFLKLKQLIPKEVNPQGITLKTKLQDITLKISYKVKRGPKKRKEKKRNKTKANARKHENSQQPKTRLRNQQIKATPSAKALL